MEQAIIAAGGDGLVPNWPRKRTFEVLRAALAEGLDFRLDYLPQVTAFAQGARKGSRGCLEVPANTEIMAAARAVRDRRCRPPNRVSAFVLDPAGGAEKPIDAWIDPPSPSGKRLGGSGGKTSLAMEASRLAAEILGIGK